MSKKNFKAHFERAYKGEESTNESQLNDIEFSVNEVFEDVQDLPKENPEDNRIEELENKVYAIMQKLEIVNAENEKLKQDNESLMKNKLKLSFEKAQELYKRKNKLIHELKTFEHHKEEINQAVNSLEEEALFESGKFCISFENKQGYRDEAKFKVSNSLIVTEFIKFILEKIDLKIIDLKSEIETIDI